MPPVVDFFFFSFLFRFLRGRERASPTRVLWWSTSGIRCVARRGQQRRLNYVPDANTADCSVPLASSIHLSASLKIPLMRCGICIRSHFEYDTLSSQARPPPLVVSPSPFFSHLVASRFLPLPRDADRCSLIAPSESIDDRISIGDQGSVRTYTAVERSFVKQ